MTTQNEQQKRVDGEEGTVVGSVMGSTPTPHFRNPDSTSPMYLAARSVGLAHRDTSVIPLQLKADAEQFCLDCGMSVAHWRDAAKGASDGYHTAL